MLRFFTETPNIRVGIKCGGAKMFGVKRVFCVEATLAAANGVGVASDVKILPPMPLFVRNSRLDK